ncbi:MAG: RagB/SusD family nutrient uptake outer membrane protein [Lewinellaceae bacterium]|nr:RagB/SusD family nutrient uptake outer membrane protein [Saprospiraceae bacterium]MCB9333110.1 RagB/SusD family nutrient uptake outer membrane protein [Lewinellaceae bacterium]
MSTIHQRALLLAILACCMFGCSKFLDDPQSSTSLPVEAAFQNGQDLEEALTGVYDLCQDGHLYGRNFIVLPELIGGNAVFYGGGFFGLEYVSALNMTATDWYAENSWLTAYAAINQLNAVLAFLPGIRNSDAALSNSQANRIEGEALFLRGLLYFDLVRLFALPIGLNAGQQPGVPLMLNPVLKKEDFQFPEQASVVKVYEQINRDLAAALPLLPEYNSTGRPGQHAARAFLARMAFQEGRYSDAASYTEAMLSSAFDLTDSPQDFFTTEGNTEEIWTLPCSPEDPNGGLSTVFGLGGGNQTFATADYLQAQQEIISPAQQNALGQAGYTAVDLRTDTGYLVTHPLLVQDGVVGWRTNKFEQVQEESDDIPMVRFAEILLLRAEALARLQGSNTESVELLNRVRRRAIRVVDAGKQLVPGGAGFIEYKTGDFPDANSLIEAIIRERRIELAFEGNFFHDQMRLQRPVQGLGYDTCRLRLPIPQRELDVNPNLKQHSCYQ